MTVASSAPPSNAEVARRLGLNHSTVSRMRAGKRAASITTIYSISKEYSVPVEPLLAAAAELHSGKPANWVALINATFDAA